MYMYVYISEETNSWKIPISLMIQAMKTLDAFLILKNKLFKSNCATARAKVFSFKETKAKISCI